MKNTTYFLFFCCIGLFFATCKVPSFIEKKMVVFDTGFPVDRYAYGTWYDKKHKKEYIYFGSGADSARIRFFTLDGQRQSEIQDIPLLTNRGVEDVMDKLLYVTEASFSIHIYDAKFKKLSEQYFEGGKYDYRFIFLTSQGLFIAQNENNKDYDPTKCKFFLFEIKQ